MYAYIYIYIYIYMHTQGLNTHILRSYKQPSAGESRHRQEDRSDDRGHQHQGIGGRNTTSTTTQTTQTTHTT